MPILKRGFNDKKTAIKRKCAVITENMAKLVKKPAEVASFMPVLQPLLAKGIREIADPECRARFTAAEEVLSRVGTKGKEVERKKLEEKATIEALQAAMTANGASDASVKSAVVTFCGQVCMSLGNVSKNFLKVTWEKALTELLAPCFVEGEAAAALAVDAARVACATMVGENTAGGESEEYVDPEPEIEDLCNLEFSLAYGSKILLNNSRLHLKKGFKYGVMSKKSAGKTTMMRAIANQQVEGFPYEGVRTIFIENDIQGSQMEMNCTEFLTDSIGFGTRGFPRGRHGAAAAAAPPPPPLSHGRGWT